MTDDEWITMMAGKEDGCLVSTGSPSFDVGNLTLAKLVEQIESLPKFQKMPPYYRCHPVTYQQLMGLIPTREPTDWMPEWVNFYGVRIEQDVEVEPGVFLPPKETNS